MGNIYQPDRASYINYTSNFTSWQLTWIVYIASIHLHIYNCAEIICSQNCVSLCVCV